MGVTVPTTDVGGEAAGAAVPPLPECDVIMKGGITSGVIYPTALSEIASRYRIRGIGGASAGAIGASAGAAAEFGRSRGGYDVLRSLPGQLGEGRLATLFQAQPSTRPLLSLMLVATGSDRPGPRRKGLGRILAIVGAALRAFPWASLVGALPGVALITVGAISGGTAGWLLVVAGVLLLAVGCAVAIGVRLYQELTVDVPENLFGICRGLGEDDEHPGFTDWLGDRIDEMAAIEESQRPLTFGHLWRGDTSATAAAPSVRQVDLRMITTCLSEGRPYEMPWDARRFFFDPGTWRTLFPKRVVDALEAAPPPIPTEGDEAEWRWEEQVASHHEPPLRRLPDPEHLPVIVATRMSLSFPLLISAVPLWAIDRRHPQSREAIKRYRESKGAGEQPPDRGLRFAREWFTDGGFCSNFPVHLFDAALASRPTFAINLGRFPGDRQPDPDQEKNVEWAKSNREGLLPVVTGIPDRGVAAVGAFASAALNTARGWQDGSHLDHPGFRDRIVRVLQTKSEGGMNLHMDTPTIEGLADRGKAAASVLIEQFNEPRYPEKNPTATGWDNHRWVRYRALLSVLPDWLASYSHGRAVLGLDPADPPSYRLSKPGRELAAELTQALDDAAKIAANADPEALADLTEAPRPKGILRRIPRV